MTEVGHADLSRILQARRNECSSIVTSRKRKLRELFAVASHTTNLPEHGLTGSDAPAAATTAEWQFLCAADIVQGRRLDESNIPPRPKLSLDLLKQQRAESLQSAINHKGPSDPPDETLSSGALPTKEKGFLPPVVNIPTPISLDKATTSIESSWHPSARGALSPQQVLEPDANLAYSSDSTRKDTEEAAHTAASVTDRNAKKDSIVKRPAHVKFPPGTKGSPSADPSPADFTNANSANLSDYKTNSISETQASQARSESNSASLSIKLPSDTSRVPDALSTPGSTAPSATTPAIHDISTDTSPDRDGPRYLDAGSSKDSSASGEAHSQASRDGSQEQTSSAEDQLLYESMQSSVSAKQEAVPITTSNHANHTIKPAGTVTPVANVPRARQTSSTAARLPLAEVPDSQECTPNPLDAEAREIKPEAKEHVFSTSWKSNLVPTHDLARVSPNLRMQAEGQGATLERAVTRVSSGAIRRKSVNEIVGGLLRPPVGAGRDINAQEVHQQSTICTSIPQSSTCRDRDSAAARKERFKNHVASTVLFGKQPMRVDDRALTSSRKETIQASDDYYTPLFVQNFAGTSKWMQPLDRILFQANKTISTPDAHLVIQDHQACRVLRRVYHLQQHDKWSLRQPKRSPEPIRPRSQWDTMLQEMRWMRTDFREERKWKMVVARNLAYACAEWHRASAMTRKSLQVETTIPPKWPTVESQTDLADSTEDDTDSQPIPDLVPSGDGFSPQNVDELVEDFGETVSPSAIFALHEDDVVFGLDRTAASEKLLMELPMYGSPLKVPLSNAANSDTDPDSHWRRPALPLSKYVEGEMKLTSRGVPTMRSRFEYSDEEESDDKDSQFTPELVVQTIRLLPSTDEVAFFQPESKHVRDRLHAGHQFRPPSEHPMPTQSFYEARSPSQWTMAEDDELRGLVREYSYNWSLISSMLSIRSSFVAGAERRTPWECFERWIILEGLPTDMQKMQYFRTYNHRIEAAQRAILQHNQLAVQQASASGGTVTLVRRRPSTPVRVERRRNQKHLTMLDAMRKLAKKRETVMQKQQHSASHGAASKKINESLPSRQLRTPKDYSLMRWERDQALAEKMSQYAQRQESQWRPNLHTRQGQAGQGAGAAGTGMQSQSANHHVAASANINGTARSMSNQMVAAAAAAAAAAAGQGRPCMPMQAPVGGVQVPMNGSLAAPSQMAGAGQTQVSAAQGQHRLPMVNQAPDPNLMLRAQRISEQQRVAVQIQQAQAQQQQYQHQPSQQMGNPGISNGTSRHSSPPMRNGMNGLGQQSMMSNAQAMRGSYATPTTNNSGINSSQVNTVHLPTAANVSSPASRSHPQLPPAIAAQLAHLESTFRNKTPSLTSEQVRQLAMEQLTRNMMALRQSHPNSTVNTTAQPAIAASLSPPAQPSLSSSLSPTTQPGIPSGLAPSAQSGMSSGLGSPAPSGMAPSLPSTAQSSLASGLPSTSSPHQYAALLRQQQQNHAQQHFQPHQHPLQQQQQQQQPHHYLHQHQRQHGLQAKAMPPSQFQKHAAPQQGTSAPPVPTSTVASASPVLVQQQRVSNGNATLSSVGN